MKKPPDMPRHIRGLFLVYRYIILHLHKLCKQAHILLDSYLLFKNKKVTMMVLLNKIV